MYLFITLTWMLWPSFHLLFMTDFVSWLMQPLSSCQKSSIVLIMGRISHLSLKIQLATSNSIYSSLFWAVSVLSYRLIMSNSNFHIFPFLTVQTSMIFYLYDINREKRWHWNSLKYFAYSGSILGGQCHNILSPFLKSVLFFCQVSSF